MDGCVCVDSAHFETHTPAPESRRGRPGERRTSVWEYFSLQMDSIQTADNAVWDKAWFGPAARMVRISIRPDSKPHKRD